MSGGAGTMPAEGQAAPVPAQGLLSPFAIRRKLDVLDEPELAGLLGVDKRTVQRWRVEGQGPAYVKVGNTILFRLDDVREWLARRVEPTAEIKFSEK